MPTEKTAQQLREEQIARLVNSFEQRLRNSYPRTPQTLEEIERRAQEIGEKIKQEIQQEIVDAHGSGYAGATCACGCAGSARYKGQVERRLVSLHGEVVLVRAYYWCARCRRGFCPLDKTLDLGQGQTSLSVRILACRFASLLPFEKAAKELELVCGVHLSASTLQRIAKQTGHEMGRMWQEQQAKLSALEQAPAPMAARLHISMDGVMAHVDGVWREVKLGVCYARGKQGPTKACYYATLAGSQAFGRQVKTLGLRCGEARCRQVAVVADGSAWIWQEAGKHYTCRVQILDFWHVSQHLYSVSAAAFGTESRQAKEWMSVQQKRLKADEGARVIQEIEHWQPGTEVGRQLQRKVLGYLEEHAHRMRYKSFAEAGYHIGSGVMESSCRWVVQQRMKGSGMRWRAEGAESMLQLRTACCSELHADIRQATRRAMLHA